MNAVDHLCGLGLSVTPIDGGRLRIRGLKQLDRKTADTALSYARAYKAQILADLSPTWGLPEVCPLLNLLVPDQCRFEARLFKRMVSEGVLHFGGPCPLRKVCRL